MAKRTILSTTISIGANLTGLKKGLKIAQRSLKKFGSQAKRVGGAITSNVTLPFAAAGAAGVKMATDLQTSFSKIENLVGITGKALDDFKGSVRAVSNETGKTQQELSEALFTIASAGLRGAEATQVLERAAKASSIGLGDTQQIAQALTGVLQAYAGEGLTAARATDVLTAIVREGNLEAESLAPTLGRVVGVASQLGVSFEEVGANIATFTRLGVPAEEAVVGLRGIMTSLLKPTKDSEQTLLSLGLSAQALRDKVGKEGLQSTLAFLMESFEGNDAAISSVFGNVRALSAVLGTAGAQGEQYASVLDNIENSTGIVDDGFKNVSETSGFKFQKTLTTLKNSAIELGNALLPLVTRLADFLTNAINGFRNLDTATKTTLLTITGLVAAAGPIMSAIGVISGALAALLSPAGLVVAGIALIAAAFISFWPEIRGVFVKIANAFIAVYNESTAFRFVVNLLILPFKNLWTVAKAVFNALGSSFRGLGKIIKGIFTGNLDLAREGFRDWGNGIKDSVNDVIDGVFSNVNKAVENTFEPKKEIEFVTEEGVQKGVDNLLGPLKKGFQGIKDMFTFRGGTGGGGGGTTSPPEIIATTGEEAEKATPKVNKLAEAFKALKNNVDVVGLLVNELGSAFQTVFTHTINAALGDTEQSFKEMTQGVIQDLKALVVKLIAAAVAAAALVALLAMAGIGGFSIKTAKDFAVGFKSMFASMSGVRLAKGGLAYGETLAVVGDNPNARMDPEVIAPLSKLQNIIGNAGGGRVEVVGRISGQDIILSSEKASRVRTRYRGF